MGSRHALHDEDASGIRGDRLEVHREVLPLGSVPGSGELMKRYAHGRRSESTAVVPATKIAARDRGTSCCARRGTVERTTDQAGADEAMRFMFC